MGIQGLTTFIARNADRSLENYNLHNGQLVIDGNSLAVQLYQNSTRCNSAFGGDYDVYAHTIKKFFNALSKCKIFPYVIFDGGYEEKKMKTVLKRLKCRIVDASRLNPKNQLQYLVFPLLMKDVFLEVLISLNVAYTFCEFEADHEIAAVARYLQCPVLSYDSDFFVYNVTYIPFPSLTLKPSLLKTSEGVNYVLKCKLYRAENFLKLFPGVDDNILPLIATLLGNDYVKRSVFSKFYHNLRQSKSKKMTEGQCRIVAVIEWLQNESFDSAIEKVLSHFKISERVKVQKCINVSCSNYTRTYCNSLQDLGISSDSKIDDLHPEKDKIKEIKSKQSTSKKNWITSILKCGKISARFYDLVHKSFYIANPQAEDFSSSDSNLSSLPILRFSFDILTGFDKRQMVLECRKGIHHKTINIDYPTYLPDEVINNIWINKNEPPKCELFYAFLEKSMDRAVLNGIAKLPGSLQMLTLSILWILKSFKDNLSVPNESQVYSVILCFINLSLLKVKIGRDFSHYELVSKFSEELKVWCDQSKNRLIDVVPGFEGLDENNISYEDCMIASSKMLKYFEVDGKVLAFPKVFKCQFLHFFAQFQCCLQQLSYLNVLTSEPFKPCIISKTYNGTFVYNMYSNLKKRDSPGAYIYQLLQCSPTVLNYFIVIANFLGFNSCCPPQQDKQRNNKLNKRSKKNVIEIVTEEHDLSSDSVSEEDCDELNDVNNRFNVLKM